MTKNNIVHHASVSNHDAQQISQRRAGPVTPHIAFGKTNVARLERLRAHGPIVNLDTGKGCLLIAKAPVCAVRQMHTQRAMLQALEQSQQTLGRCGHPV